MALPKKKSYSVVGEPGPKDTGSRDPTFFQKRKGTRTFIFHDWKGKNMERKTSERQKKKEDLGKISNLTDNFMETE